MDCKEIRELLPLYIDEGLDADEMETIRLHLDVCPECQEEVAVYKEMRKTLLDLPEIPLPTSFKPFSAADMKKHVMQPVAVGTKEKKKLPWKQMTAIAAVLLVGISTVGIMGQLKVPDREDAYLDMTPIKMFDLDLSGIEENTVSDAGSDENMAAEVDVTADVPKIKEKEKEPQSPDTIEEKAVIPEEPIIKEQQAEQADELIAARSELPENDGLESSNAGSGGNVETDDVTLFSLADAVSPNFDLIQEEFSGYEIEILEQMAQGYVADGSISSSQYRVLVIQDGEGNEVNQEVIVRVENDKVIVLSGFDEK